MRRSDGFVIPAAAAPVPLAERWTVADEAFAEFLRRPRTPARERRMLREKLFGGSPAEIQRTKERIYDLETERLRGAIRAARREAA